MKQLIFIEGLPGTGKTATTQKLSEYFSSKGQKVITLFEGDERIPSDFYEMAGIPADEFNTFCTRYPQAADELGDIPLRTKNYVYLRLDRCSGFIDETFRKWDMGDELNQQVSVEQYISCALERIVQWTACNIENENIVIIDSGFLQNPVNELLFRKASDDVILSFIQQMAEIVRPLNPICFYLKRENAETAISFAKQIKGPDWISHIDAMLSNTGCPNLFEHRFNLELQLLSCIRHIICSVCGYDWTDIDRKIALLS